MTALQSFASTAIAALGLFAAAGGALAQTSFAAQTSVSSISPCPSFCGGPGARFGSDIDGGEGFTSSQSELSNLDGNGRAEAMLNGPAGLPVLRAEAFATGLSSRVDASATGMQGFYVGQGGLSMYSLELALTGQATGTVRADVLVFRDTDPGSLPFFSSDLGSMQFEVIPSESDLQLLHAFSMVLPATNLPASVLDTVDIPNVAVGDLFYVWARLSATGQNGSYGDAYNTLNLSFADATGLSQLAPVPEPGSGMMLAAGLVAVLVRRRRVMQRRKAIGG